MPLHYTVVHDVCLLDAETPLGVYLKIREHFHQPLFFETAPKEPGAAHRSYICFEPLAGISARDGQVTRTLPGNGSHTTQVDDKDVVDEVIAFLDSVSVAACAGYEAGLFGYIGYAALRYFENIGLPVCDAEPLLPDLRFDLYRYTLIFDHSSNELSLYTLHRENDTQDRHREVLSLIRNTKALHYPFTVSSAEKCDASEEAYLAQVARGKEACRRGDVFQVVLSRAFEIGYRGDDLNVFRKLKSINPSPYSFYFDYGFRLFGASPEAQFRIDQGKAFIHPIAGTYRRTGDPQEDHRLVQQLKEDSKENAEHVMLVDLARNDLNKHYTRVYLNAERRIEQYSHVIHMVSVVEADTPAGNVHPFRILADTFPAGTLSGAPKHRAMQLISATESSPRDFYGGCIGFIGLSGSIDMAILIRSFLSNGHTLRYRAGAGITIQSDPESELQEINHKVHALRTAIKLAHEDPGH